MSFISLPLSLVWSASLVRQNKRGHFCEDQGSPKAGVLSPEHFLRNRPLSRRGLGHDEKTSEELLKYHLRLRSNGTV